MSSKMLSSLVAMFLGLSGIAHADTASKQSDCCRIKVGGSALDSVNELNGAGVPSVGVAAYNGGERITFSTLKSLAPIDANGVTRVLTANVGASSNALGDFNFKQVSSQEIYFGEWSREGIKNDPTRTVYYVGDNGGRVLPTTNVTYAVQGISQYSGANILQGELSASFGAAVPSVTGSLANNSLKVEIDAVLNKSAALFEGAAVAYDPSTNEQLSRGSSKGSFFGAGAAASVAGVAYFGNRDYDVAFGGVKK